MEQPPPHWDLRARPKRAYPPVGTVVEAKWDRGDEWFRGKIKKVRAGTSSRDPSFDVAYDDGAFEESVRLEDIRVVSLPPVYAQGSPATITTIKPQSVPSWPTGDEAAPPPPAAFGAGARPRPRPPPQISVAAVAPFRVQPAAGPHDEAQIIPSAKPWETRLGGFLLQTIRNVNKHEEQTFFHWFSAIAGVGQLEHVRLYIRQLGTTAKAVANARKLKIEFTGSAFETDAVAFFGPVRDGEDVEEALGKYYLHLKSQTAIVDYANSTGMEPQWVFQTRKDQLADFRYLIPGFKEDCREYVDEEGNIMYTKAGFVEAFAKAMVQRHAGMQQKSDIHDFTVKMRKRRVRLEKWAKHMLKKKKVYYIELWRRHAGVANPLDRPRRLRSGRVVDDEVAATATGYTAPGAALDATIEEEDSPPPPADLAGENAAPDAMREEESPPPPAEPTEPTEPAAPDAEPDAEPTAPTAPDASLGEEASPPPADHTEAPAPAPAPRGPKRKSASGGTSSRPTKKPRIGYDELIKTGAGVGGLLIAFALGFNGTSGA